MRALLIVGAMALCATQLSAQNRFALSGGAVYATVSGDDFTGTNAGIGFKAQVRNVGPRFTVGAGFAMTQHSVDGTDEKLNMQTIFLEPRYYLSASGAIQPFLVGRAGMVRQTMKFFVHDTEATGTVFGGGAGFSYSLASNLLLNFAGTYNMLSFGDMKVDGTSTPGSSTSGNSVVGQVGLMYVLGK